jgi:hypothetical protein
MMLRDDSFQLLSRAQAPAQRNRNKGNFALGASALIALVAAFAGAPRPVKSLAFASSAAIAGIQWLSTSNPKQRQAAELSKALQQYQSKAVQQHLQTQLATQEVQLKLEADNIILQQIAKAPLPLQPLLLERSGYGWLVPVLTGKPATIPTQPSPSVKKQITQYTPDLAHNDASRYAWIDTVLNAPAVLLFGPQGSGKSTLAEYLVQQRLTAGHDVEILDPHLKFGAWAGVPAHGAGMDYRALDDRLMAFEELCRDRYAQFSSTPDFNPRPKTLVAEEFTNWAQRCENAAEFFAASLSDNRKVKLHVVYISHGRTLTALGNAKGMADMRDRGLLEIELIGAVGTNGQATPSGKAKIRYPGDAAWQEVQVPDLSSFQFNAKTT